MKKRIIALLIVCVLLVSLVPVMPTLAYGSSSVDLPRNNVVGETVTVTADGAGCQWQVKIGEVWVNISGATSPELALSYAMFANIPGAPVIRCVDASGNAASDEIVVNFVDAVEPATKPAPAPEVITQPVVDAIITEPNGSAPVVQQPVVQEPVVQEPAAQTPVDTAALQQALADAKAADEAAQAAAAAAQAEADAKKAVLDAAQAEYDAAAAAVAAAQAALDASIVPVEEGQEPAPLDATLSAALSNAQLTAADAEAKLTAAKADYDAVAAVAAEANAAAADTAAAVAAAQAALDAAAPAVVPASGTPKLKMASFNLAKNVAAPAADEPSGLTTFNVVINYVFENNEPVADSYTAQLAAGSNFSASVTFPTVQGYLPYVDNVQKNGHEINIQNIQESTTITVVYKPTDVNYTVIHYQQNVDNDNYTEVARETLTGKTNSTVPEVAKNYSGFFALLYERPTIAADASTVVEIYYDRNYYLMNFELDGGYGTEPVYARYGAPIGTVNTPTKAGYTFTGWSDVKDGTTPVTVPSNMPAANTTYYAIWEMGDTAKVKVVFWGENPNDEEYSYLATGTVNVKPGTEYTFSDGNTVFLICNKEEHTHTAQCNVCGKEEHIVHTEDCLDCGHNCLQDGCVSTNGTLVEVEKPDRLDVPSSNSVQSYTTGGFIGATRHYYLYLNGKWYTNSVSDTRNITYRCTHTHTDACYLCETHEHTAACYSCGMEEHTHTSSCNQTGSGLDSKLWEFVRSETVTVEADGSSIINVYYDRVKYTFRFRVNSREIHSFSAKWGSNIRDNWTFTGSNGTTYSPENQDSWKGNTLYTERIYLVEIMPTTDITFTRASGNNSSRTFYYYVESLENTAGENKRQFEGKYYDYEFELENDFNTLYYDEDFFELEGFTRYKSARANGTEYPLSNYGTDPISELYFYYTRNVYDIEFYNPTELLRTEDDVPYEAGLGPYDFDPTPDQAPAMYEPGSVVFAGWYLNPECTGDEYILSEHTMPIGPKNGATALSLYAKWVPVSHTVTFYLDKDAYDAGTELTTHPAVTVPHGEKIDPVPAKPTNGAYDFVEWFYIDDEGKEAAFNFENMPIRQDLEVYAKWSSNVLRPYTVYFKIQGTDTQIADPIESSGVAGHTKTFDAKANEELYTNYQEGYFPIVRSHSMTLNIEGENTFTFCYVQKDAVPYTVHYVSEGIPVNGDTLGTIVIDGKTYYKVAESYTDKDNRKAVVTEKFKPVNGMMPDAYQKRLIVDGTDGATNEIIFYYVRDEKHAYYQITHYTEDVSGTGWTEYASSQAVGDIGQTYSAEPMTITGFTYDSTVAGTLTSGKLTESGLELKLYYKRNPYPYIVKYAEYGTGKELAKDKTGTAKYGTVHSENAIDIENYTVVGDAEKSITIKVEDGNEAKVNVIIFYYEENKVTINYEVVGPLGCGIVTPSSETVKIKSEDAKGSQAIPAENFRFVGWYTDEACTKPVDANLVDANNKFVPAKVDGKNVAATYYAKFEYDVTTLTITKSGAENRGYGLDGFIFKVEDSSGNVVATVAISGNGSTTIGGLKVGETYTVSEDSSWSGLYSCANQSVTLLPNGNTVTMVNSYSATNLLNGGDSVTNKP